MGRRNRSNSSFIKFLILKYFLDKQSCSYWSYIFILYLEPAYFNRASLVAQLVKNLPAM